MLAMQLVCIGHACTVYVMLNNMLSVSAELPHIVLSSSCRGRHMPQLWAAVGARRACGPQDCCCTLVRVEGSFFCPQLTRWRLSVLPVHPVQVTALQESELSSAEVDTLINLERLQFENNQVGGRGGGAETRGNRARLQGSIDTLVPARGGRRGGARVCV